MQYQVFTSSVPHNVKDVIRNVAPDAQTMLVQVDMLWLETFGHYCTSSFNSFIQKFI